MIRAVIIEDEPRAAIALEKLLDELPHHVRIDGVADRFDDALALIESARPELLFLDIKLADCTGFEVLHACDQSQLEVIFTTAYDKMAIKAFEENAIGYLLKPIDPDALERTVERAATMLNLRRKEASFEEVVDMAPMVEANASEETSVEGLIHHSLGPRLTINSSQSAFYIPVDTIIVIAANGAYSTIKTTNGATHVITRNIGSLEKELLEMNFVRCHRSYLVNAEYIEGMKKGKNGRLLIARDLEIPIAGSKRKAIHKMFYKQPR